MDSQQVNNLKQYADLKTQIIELEQQLEELKPIITDMVDEAGGRLETQGLGSFYFTQRTTWEYSKKVKEMEQKIKDLKKVEELKKIATIKNISRALCFKKDL